MAQRYVLFSEMMAFEIEKSCLKIKNFNSRTHLVSINVVFLQNHAVKTFYLIFK